MRAGKRRWPLVTRIVRHPIGGGTERVGKGDWRHRRPDAANSLHRRQWLRGALAAALGVAWSSSTTHAEESVANLSSREARELARTVIPFDRLTPPTQERLWGVVGRPSLYRRLPVNTIQCDPDLYLFFLRNPEVVVQMWQLMGITSLNVKRTGAYTFDARDNAGTQSNVELVYGTPDTHVYLADGAYEGPLLKRRTPGRAVLVLKSDYVRDRSQRVQVTNQLDAFVQLDQAAAEFVVKTLQPVIGKTADHNFRETLTFVSRVSAALEKNSTGVERLASRMTGLEPAVRDKFVQVATAVNHKAVLRQADTDAGATSESVANRPPASGRLSDDDLPEISSNPSTRR